MEIIPMATNAVAVPRDEAACGVPLTSSEAIEAFIGFLIERPEFAPLIVPLSRVYDLPLVPDTKFLDDA